MRTKAVLVRAGFALALVVCSCGTLSTDTLKQSIEKELQKMLAADSQYVEFEMTVQSVDLNRTRLASASQTGFIKKITRLVSDTAYYDGTATVLFDYDSYTVHITAEAGESEYKWALGDGAFNFLKDAVYIKMLPVKGGKFYMGCTSEQGADCYNKERPAHIVTVGDFLIGWYPVTQKQWVQVMGSNPSEFKGDGMPVENVSWNDAQAFIKKLNLSSGKTYRLPTEAEWEYAARGGIKSEGLKYAGSAGVDDAAWHFGNSDETTHPAGTKRPNELGIYDMSGNVWEWVEDRYGAYSETPKTNPGGPLSGSTRVNRGGSWEDDARYCRTSTRSNNTPESRYNSLGFRLARTQVILREDGENEAGSAPTGGDAAEYVRNGMKFLESGDNNRKPADYDLAVAEFDKAILLSQSNAEAYYGRGRAYLRKGDNSRAVADYSQAIRLNPNDAISYSNRGRAYARLGNYDQAVADFEAAHRIDPNNEAIKQNLEKARRREKGL